MSSSLRSSLSLLQRALKTPSSFKASTPIQCRRANPHSPCSRRSPLVHLSYLISFHLSFSLITFASLTRDLILIRSIICLLFKHLHISTNPYLPRYSLRDPSSLTTISRLSGVWQFTTSYLLPRRNFKLKRSVTRRACGVRMGGETETPLRASHNRTGLNCGCIVKVNIKRVSAPPEQRSKAYIHLYLPN